MVVITGCTGRFLLHSMKWGRGESPFVQKKKKFMHGERPVPREAVLHAILKTTGCTEAGQVSSGLLRCMRGVSWA